MAESPQIPPTTDYAPSAMPSRWGRVLAFGSILIAGLCGGLIGYAVVDLQCEGDCTTAAGFGAIAGAVSFAVGVGIVAVLALRAVGEWRQLEDDDAA